MILQEFSDQFEVLYNNVMSNAAPGLNEYEKSVFLTKAMYEIVKNYFNPKGNKYQEGFDDSAKRQVDFSMLIKTAKPTLTTSADSFDVRSKVCNLPTDMLDIINEVIVLTDTQDHKFVRQIVPISYDDYTRAMNKPYKEPLKNQAWRIITGKSTANSITQPLAEIIINHNDLSMTAEYRIRYVRKPAPIILVDLSSEAGQVSIGGLTGPSECELDSSIHEEILQRAVELAKAAYASDQNGQAQMQNQITVGQRSE